MNKQIQLKIDHPNVVKLYEIFEDDDFFYMVLEFMSGGEVRSFLNLATRSNNF